MQVARSGGDLSLHRTKLFAPSDAHDIAIVEAVITLAARYGFETIAEGVENLPQIAYLSGVGCTYAQGFAYARPMPAAVFEAWLMERQQLRASA
jgi:EAL domain-containing protein (putative c-di-GMP-specific phosphodiesterase class I)